MASLVNIEPEQWPTVSRLLNTALDLVPEARERWLAGLAPDLMAHAATLRALLAAHRDVARTEFLGALPALDLERWEDAAAEELPPGSTLGAYTIDAPLGRGGMSDVYRAHRSDGTLRRPVALKVMRSGAYTPASMARFKRERDILAGLTHANIARLYDAGIAVDGQPYLAMELVDGQPIDAWCDQHTLSVRDRVALFLRVLDAVQFAHGQLVVHRDIKPSNIFVTTDGDVKLLDFGIAKLLSDEAVSGSDATQIGTMPLTISYASPEQITGSVLGVASDVYSLGVLLFQLLTGSSPYAPSHNSRAWLEEAVLRTDPLRPSRIAFGATVALARLATARRLARQLAGDLDTILLKALRKAPADRYATVQAFKEDLQRFLQGEPVLALPVSVWYRTRKFVLRHRLQTAAVAIAVMLIAGFIVGLTTELRRVRLERDRADRLASFMAQVFRAPDPSAGHPETISARDLLDGATALIESDTTPDPVQRASLAVAMARSYTNLGAFPQAERLLRRELVRARAALGQNDDAALSVETELVWDLYSAREHTAAVALGLELLARERRLFGPDDARTVLTESKLYSPLASVGRFAESAELAAHAARIQSLTLGANSIDVLSDEADAAWARFRAGQGSPQDAEARLRTLVERSDVVLGPTNFSTLSAINRLSVVLSREGRFAEEVTVLRSAIARASESAGAGAAPVIDMVDNLAAALLHEKDLDGAEEALRHAMSLRLLKGASDNPRVAQEEYNMACVLAQRGKKEEALLTLQSAIEHRLIPDAALHMQADDDLAPLLGDPRFTALVRRVHDLYATPTPQQVVPPA
jgi:serine/threonine protein kinase